MNLANFFAELKRRNVYKVAIAYAVVGWLLIQIATQVFPFFEIPNWGVRLDGVVDRARIPDCVDIAWAFELTPEGIKRTEAADRVPGKSRGRTGFMLSSLPACSQQVCFSRTPHRAYEKQIAKLVRSGKSRLRCCRLKI